MKISNFFKAIFVILIIAIVIFLAILLIKKEDNKKNDENNVVEGNEEYQTDLRLAVADLDTFNPIISDNRNVYETSHAFYEPLISLDANYRKEYCLAENIKKISDKEYIVCLRDNVYFSNEQKLNSKDLQFTINTINKTNSIYTNNIEAIKKTQVIDDLQLKLILSRPVDYFEYKLTFPVMQLTNDKRFKDTKNYPIPPRYGII